MNISRLGLALAFVVLLVPASVVAADVPRLSGPITDQTGVLAGTSGTTVPAIERLKRDSNVDLWVLFVRTTGTAAAGDFAADVARLNSLGVNDVLLLVALDDRTDSMWVSDGLPQLTDARIDAIISTRVEPRLAAGDHAGAIVGAATGLGEAVGAAPGASAGVTPSAKASVTAAPGASAGSGGTPSTSSGGGIGILPILVVIGLIVGAFMVYRRLRPARPAVGPAASGPSADLERQANSLLIETDEAVRDADQELGFVEAQFGSAEAATFRSSQDQAAAEMKAAFMARQQLDDATPEDRAGRDRLLREIVDHGTKARSFVTAQQNGVAALRDIEKSAPDLVQSLPAQVAAARGRLNVSRTAMAGLGAFAPATWQAVTGNIPEAEKRVDFADAAIARAGTTLTGGDRGGAAAQVRQAQIALAETTTLLDAVDRLAASLADVRDRLPAALTAADTDVSAARTAIPAGAPAGDLAGRMADAERLLALARAAAAGSTPDVLEAYRAATEANAAADTVIATAHVEQDRSAQRRALLDAATRTAGLSITRTSDFIASRRGAIGGQSRTRLAEAQRASDTAAALAGSNLDAALASAQRAERFADDALRLAGEEFTAYERSAPPVVATGGAGATGAFESIDPGTVGGGGWGGTTWGGPTPPGGFPSGVGSGWGGLGGRTRSGRW